ncbi:ABC transporter substrate-binding protein [Magnetococcales bacterium HHB-1]
MKKSTLFLAVVIVTLVSLAGVFRDNLLALIFPVPYTIAVAVDHPGPQGEASTLYQGALALVEEVNRSGGIGGHPVALTLYDDLGDPQKGVQVAKEIASSSATAVIGHRISSVSVPAAQVYRQHKIPVVTPTATLPAVTEKNPWSFRVVYNNRYMAKFLASYLKNIHDPTTVFVLEGQRNRSFNRGLTALFKQGAEEQSLPLQLPARLIDAESPQVDATIAQLITDLREARKEGRVAVFLSLFPKDAYPVIKRLRDSGVDATLIGSDTLDKPLFVRQFSQLPAEAKSPGFYTDDILVATPLVFDAAGLAMARFREQYVARFNDTPDWRAVFAYDAAKVLVEAIRRGGFTPTQGTATERRQAIRAALSAMNAPLSGVQGLTGVNYFDAQGDVLKPVAIARLRNRTTASAPIQFEEIKYRLRGEELEKALAEGRAIQIDQQVLGKTAIVSTGASLNALQAIDLEKGVARLSGYIWFRAQPYSVIDPTAKDKDFPFRIAFTNARTPPEFTLLTQQKAPDGSIYRRYHFEGDFITNFMTTTHKVRGVTVGFAFRHRDRPPNNRLIYVADTIGLGFSEGRHFKDSLTAFSMQARNLSFKVQEAALYQKVEWISSLGMPRYAHLPGGEIPVSTFVVTVKLQEF